MKDIIIITGGTSGLELVRQSIEKGFIVCNIDRNTGKMDELNKQYGENHKGFIGVYTGGINCKAKRIF